MYEPQIYTYTELEEDALRQPRIDFELQIQYAWIVSATSIRHSEKWIATVWMISLKDCTSSTFGLVDRAVKRVFNATDSEFYDLRWTYIPMTGMVLVEQQVRS